MKHEIIALAFILDRANETTPCHWEFASTAAFAAGIVEQRERRECTRMVPTCLYSDYAIDCREIHFWTLRCHTAS